MSERPASSRRRRSSGRAPRPIASVTASSSGSRASARTSRASVRSRAPPGPAIAPPMIASAWRQRARASRYGSPMAPQRSARSAQRAGSSRPARRAWYARAVARLASGSPRPAAVLGAGARDGRLGLGEDPRGALAGRGHVADPAPLQRLGDDRGLHLQRGRGHPGDEDPVLAAAEARPAALGGPAGVGQVARPHRVGRRCLVGRDRELQVAAGLQLHEDPAQEPPGLLARLGLDLHEDEVEDRVHERDARRAPVERPQAQLARLAPAADVHEDPRHVPAQQVAVDGVEVQRAGLGHAGERDVHGLGRAGPGARARRPRWRRHATTPRRDPLPGRATRRRAAAAARTPGRRPSRGPRPASS